jgi:hypothetical protein
MQALKPGKKLSQGQGVMQLVYFSAHTGFKSITPD